MRTTIRMDPELLRQAKQEALDTNRTLTAVIEEAVREALARRRSAALQTQRVRLPTDGHGGLLPGVNLDDNAGLLDLMEGT
jgi:hypothetical protein